MKKVATSWGNVSEWYAEHLKGDDTYHAKVVAPNFLRMLSPQPQEKILDIGCGEGYFTRLMHASRATVTGVDIAKELIAVAKRQSPEIAYIATPAEKLPAEFSSTFDAVTCLLALQNMEHLQKVFTEVARVLKPGGRFIFVLNHPAFRIPQKSEWGWDAEKKVQFRRVDAYLSQSKHEIIMNPGHEKKEVTCSFHRSLQDYSKALFKAGFSITRFEEWISHRESEKGPKKDAEDRARKEFPLFMGVECRKV